MDICKEECISEVLKYHTRSNFRRGSIEIYLHAKRMGWLSEIYSHLPKHRDWKQLNPEEYRLWRKEWRDKNKEHVKAYGRKERFKRLHGIELSTYDNKLKKQRNRCAICGKRPNEQNNKALSLDHNHKTNAIRGLLCNNCNSGLGWFNDDITILIKAIRYLNKYNVLDDINLANSENKKKFIITAYLKK